MTDRQTDSLTETTDVSRPKTVPADYIVAGGGRVGGGFSDAENCVNSIAVKRKRLMIAALWTEP